MLTKSVTLMKAERSLHLRLCTSQLLLLLAERYTYQASLKTLGQWMGTPLNCDEHDGLRPLPENIPLLQKDIACEFTIEGQNARCPHLVGVGLEIRAYGSTEAGAWNVPAGKNSDCCVRGGTWRFRNHPFLGQKLLQNGGRCAVRWVNSGSSKNLDNPRNSRQWCAGSG
jgi:hypothetical protein